MQSSEAASRIHGQALQLNQSIADRLPGPPKAGPYRVNVTHSDRCYMPNQRLSLSHISTPLVIR